MGSFKDFLKVGNEFKLHGLSDVYRIVVVDSDEITITTLIGSSWVNFVVDMETAEDSFNIGFWAPLESEKQIKTTSKGGMFCSKCNNYFEFAEPNQDDGSLICWSCRNGF